MPLQVKESGVTRSIDKQNSAHNFKL